MDSLTLTGGNGSGGDGGACVVGDSTLRLKRSTLTGNTALGGLGGGIQMFGVAEVQVVDSLVSDNSASGAGGGLMSFSGDFTIPVTFAGLHPGLDPNGDENVFWRHRFGSTAP